MFHTSTQKSHWLFKDLNELSQLRLKTNSDYVASCRSKESVRATSQEQAQIEYLTADEEKTLVLHYEYLIKQFCGRFQPKITMPSVVGTSIAYFKRFYLRNSIMDFHPRDIYLVCIYLACKVEEFNISIGQFVLNIINTNEDRDELANIVLSYELLLMEKLDFELTIHNFYRPFEGFLLDVKARYPEIRNADILRQSAFEFLDKILNTDAILLYPPSQIALTGLVYSSSKNKIESIDKYCRKVLLSDLNDDGVKHMLTIIKNINRLHKDILVLNLNEINRIETKLKECYNTENDPRSPSFKERMRKHLEDDDEEI